MVAVLTESLPGAPARGVSVRGVSAGDVPARGVSAPVVPIDVARRRCDRPSPAQLRCRRTVAAGLALLTLLGVFLVGQALLGRPAGAAPHATGSTGTAALAGRVWVVRPGDTLWTIAQATGARGDIRPLVTRLSAEVGGLPLQPGQRIVLP